MRTEEQRAEAKRLHQEYLRSERELKLQEQRLAAKRLRSDYLQSLQPREFLFPEIGQHRIPARRKLCAAGILKLCGAPKHVTQHWFTDATAKDHAFTAEWGTYPFSAFTHTSRDPAGCYESATKRIWIRHAARGRWLVEIAAHESWHAKSFEHGEPENRELDEIQARAFGQAMARALCFANDRLAFAASEENEAADLAQIKAVALPGDSVVCLWNGRPYLQYFTEGKQLKSCGQIKLEGGFYV